jgi:predicted transcriptional regulator
MKRNKSESRKQGCCALTASEKEVLRRIFNAILESGRAPTTEKLQSSAGKSPTEIARILDELEQRDLLLRAKGTQEIQSIYPFSLVPTRHEVTLEAGRKLFAMCAVDALGMPNMFDRNVKIVSECESCKEKITLEVKKGEIVTKSHPHIIVWNFEREQGPAAQTCCPWVNFFCSDEHFREWEKKNSELAGKGQAESLDQAYPAIKERWKAYGEEIGVR